ncbi:FecR family protein [Chitinophaga sp. HK235]|uniref:FecR family protein n=1 Tax=Chitinophaga sp. HK235 TaxID=2952571 RepID=UPI001BA6B5D0|nr:FecR family protein [Chitinophaga sp. HK235]
MDKERLADIIDRITSNTATDEDLAVYNAWCDAMQEQEPEINDLAGQESRTWKKIRQQTGLAPKPKVVGWRIAAAALLTGVIAGSVLFFRHSGDRQVTPAAPSAVAALSHDVPSGKNTATLILANGKKILLADVQQGKLAAQTGAEITKTADGTLEYRPVSAGTTAAPQYNTLSTARGEQYQITLPDGTRVWLNASTTLTFPTSFAGMNTRQVEVNGEAYFEVPSDPAHPFVVRTNRQNIKVLGTHFNVNNYPDEPFAKTTLLEGAIKINDQKVLQPGQQAISSANGTLNITKVSTEGIVAWKNGYFEFNDENIYEVMRKIARWYDVEVIYEGNIPTNGMEGTISRFENVSKVLHTIQQAGLLKFRIEQQKIYVSQY